MKLHPALLLVTCHSSLVTVFNDLKFGLRILLKTPGFTILAILALALGIGANSALFSLIYSVLLSPLPFPDPEKIVWVQSTWKNGGKGGVSGPDYLDWAEQSRSFTGLCAMRGSRFNLTGKGEPKALTGMQVTTNFFDTMQSEPVLGRRFLPDESESGKNHVIILGHRLWKNLFDSDPTIVGKPITLGEEPWTIIGVAPPLMGFIEELAQMYAPLSIDTLKQNRGNHYLNVMGRLQDGISLGEAQAEMNTIALRLEQQYSNDNKNKGIFIQTLKDILVQEIRTVFLILYGAVGFLLLIACVNVANLLLAKAGSRSKEIAIRTALGAGRWRIFRQVLTESVVLSTLGGGTGLMFALWGLDLLRYIAPQSNVNGGSGIAGFEEMSLNLPILLFTLLLSVFTGILFGLAPAWQASRSSVHDTLKESGRGASSGASRHRILNGLVTTEIALSLILLMGAGLLIQSFYRLQQTGPGFDPDRILAINLERTWSAKNDANKSRAQFCNEIVRRMTELPGVESAATINFHPLSPYNSNNGFHIEGRPLSPGEFLSAEYRTVTQDFFKTMRTPLVKGRFFNEGDQETSKPVAIVSEEFVKRYLPNDEPLGMQINEGGVLKEIVGVVGDIKQRSLSNPGFYPFMYVPVEQNCWHEVSLMVRVKGDPEAMIPMLRREIWSVDPNQPILAVRTMDQIVANSISVQRFSMILLSIMAGVALLLAIIGIYGVMAFSVHERIHEIGIRMALGAQVKDILKMVVTKGLTLTLIGLGIGLACSLVVTRLMSAMLYQISATDPLTFVVVPLVLMAVALLACYIPARRAARTDPLITLRYE